MAKLKIKHPSEIRKGDVYCGMKVKDQPPQRTVQGNEKSRQGV